MLGFWRSRAPDGRATPRIRDLEGRLEDLEDGHKRLERRFLKLQGELTGAIRYQRELEARLAETEPLDEEEDDGDQG